MIRVLHFTRDYSPASKGGVSTVVPSLVQALGGQGVDCAVVSFDNWRLPKAPGSEAPRVEEVAGVLVLRVNSSTELGRVKAWSRDWQADILQVHQEFLWRLAKEAYTGRDTPAVYHAHVYHPAMNRLRKINERTLGLVTQEDAIREADAVWVPTRSIETLVATDFGAHVEKVCSMPFGLWCDGSGQRAEMRRRASDPFGVLYLARFGDLKGTQDFVAVAQTLLEMDPKIRVQLAGGIPGNPKGERRWQKRMRHLQALFPGRFELLGWVGGQEKLQLLTGADVLLAPSYFETFGLSVGEALASGTPVVGYDIGAVAELVEHEMSGFLVPPGDLEGLIHGVCKLSKSPEAAHRMGVAGRGRVMSEYAWDEKAVYYHRAYKDLIGHS
ncbi:MAG: glycosyltransferase family 4 protein [Myxococcota bacterium]|nr:glycosyltransferase family 4 protein [Myxococcota bacterium]